MLQLQLTWLTDNFLGAGSPYKAAIAALETGGACGGGATQAAQGAAARRGGATRRPTLPVGHKEGQAAYPACVVRVADREDQ